MMISRRQKHGPTYVKLVVVPLGTSTVHAKLFVERNPEAPHRLSRFYRAIFAVAAAGVEQVNAPFSKMGQTEDDAVVQRPLCFAITLCWPEALLALLKAGADPNLEDDWDDGAATTPLMCACGTRTSFAPGLSHGRPSRSCVLGLIGKSSEGCASAKWKILPTAAVA